MNLLLCSCGRRVELIKYIKQSLGDNGKVVATDCNILAPALYVADVRHIVPPIDSPDYIDEVLRICADESIDAVSTLIDPEIEVLAKNREKFKQLNVEVLAPYESTAKTCFDKFAMYNHLVSHGVPTVLTFGDIGSFSQAQAKGEIEFPVFVKPRTGSGSVGARRIDSFADLQQALELDDSLIIQEFISSGDYDADIYVDTVSHELVAAFAKKKLSTVKGGANRTVAIKSESLLETAKKAVSTLEFNGPIDIDFFEKDGQFLLSEVNPRFGGAYLHAYRAGVDFVPLIENNVKGVSNKPSLDDYEEGTVMMMYDSVVFLQELEGLDCSNV